MKPNLNLTIIGAGTMGETLASRLISTETIQARNLKVSDPNEKRTTLFRDQYGIQGGNNNAEAVAGADIVILCTKPQNAEEVIASFRDQLGEQTLVISIMAGVRIEKLEQYLQKDVPVIRAMPNTPCQVGAGMTVLAAGSHATGNHLKTARTLFDAVGETEILDEKHFDAVTGLSASSPAFIYVIIEALAEGGVKCGLPRDASTRLVAQACLGAATMVGQNGKHPAVLKDDVTTPAGCTVDGLLKLEEGGLRVTLIKAVTEAAKRAGELG